MKKVLGVLIITCSLFLSSCIKMDSELYIKDDLSLEGKMRVDYTQLNAMANSMTDFGTGVTTNQEIAMPCEQLQSSTGGLSTGEYMEMSCENISENIAEVTGKGGSIEDMTTIKDGNYLLDLKSIIDSNNSDDSKTEEENINSVNMLRTMGFEMNYSIEFPTNIIESNIGNINGKVLTFNVYDVVDGIDPYVIFENNGNLVEREDNDYSIEIEERVILIKKLILSKNELEKTYQGRKDIAKFDALIPQVKNKKLIGLHNTLLDLDFSSYRFREYKNILEYLQAKIGLEIHNRDNIQKNIN
ncbi:MAG: hypothetical protein QM490_00520 [Candidatus Gracilibacteria bacterium]